MQKPFELRQEFGEAAGALPETDFSRFLQENFGGQTARRVLDAFQQMGLPAPEKEEEFSAGTDGALVFLNRQGIVIRVEHKVTRNVEYKESRWNADRIDDNPRILSPLASIAAGEAVIEICPGCDIDLEGEASPYVWEKLWLQKIELWDRGEDNIGYIPVRTPTFPAGIPVVIDRLAVRKLSGMIRLLQDPAEDPETREIKEASDNLYGPLRRCFAACWPDAQKMRQFWELCADYARDGKLVAGWNSVGQPGEWVIDNTDAAVAAAGRYEARQAASAAPAARQAQPQSTPHR